MSKAPKTPLECVTAAINALSRIEIPAILSDTVGIPIKAAVNTLIQGQQMMILEKKAQGSAETAEENKDPSQ